MTINTTTNKISSPGDGIQTNFPYNFKVVDADHMLVYLDNVLYGAAYTVNGVGNEAGGSVDIPVPPGIGVIVTLYRSVPDTQETDYEPYRSFPSETVENDMDLAAMRDQQLQEQSDRTVKAPVDDDGSFDYTLPAVAANKGIKANATGDGWVETDSDPDEAQTDSAASAAAALVSENNAATSESNASDSADAAAASAASINLPSIQPGDDNKILQVNDAEDGYELTDTFAGNAASATEAASLIGPCAPTTMTPSAWPSFSVTIGTQNNITGIDKVDWTFEDFDTNNNFAAGAFTPTVAGKYLLTFGLDWVSLVAGDQVKMFLYKNGVATHAWQEVTSGTLLSQSASLVVDANGSTDYFEIYAQNVSRDTSDIAGLVTQFSGCRIG